jgi:hypothetical protein
MFHCWYLYGLSEGSQSRQTSTHGHESRGTRNQGSLCWRGPAIKSVFKGLNHHHINVKTDLDRYWQSHLSNCVARKMLSQVNSLQQLECSSPVKAGSVSNCHHAFTTTAYADATTAMITTQVPIKQGTENECFFYLRNVSHGLLRDLRIVLHKHRSGSHGCLRDRGGRGVQFATLIS